MLNLRDLAGKDFAIARTPLSFWHQLCHLCRAIKKDTTLFSVNGVPLEATVVPDKLLAWGWPGAGTYVFIWGFSILAVSSPAKNREGAS